MKTFLILSIISIFAISASGDERTGKGAKMNDAQTADSLLEIADISFKKNKLEIAFTQYNEAYETARKEFNKSVETEALAQLARTKLRQQDKEKGREFLTMAAEGAVESDMMGWSRYLGVKGRFEWLDDDLATARVTFSQMYDFCSKNEIWGRVVDAANMMAIVSEKTDEQIEWSKKGIDAAGASDNESWLGPLWNNLAATYYDLKDFESALSCYEKSREYHWRFSGEVAKLFSDYHIGMTLRLLGRYDEAKSWLRPVLAWAERIENSGAIGQACEDLGEIEAAGGNNTEALKWFQRAKEEYQKAGYDKSWADIWDNINKRIEEVG